MLTAGNPLFFGLKLVQRRFEKRDALKNSPYGGNIFLGQGYA
jgi:hypothetical protein